MQSVASHDLNLARKWRPQSFDTIVGQEIPVRMLKNSLFLKKFFPVYLFAGQRGCGKTTTARILAAAANCSALPSFQSDPKNNTLPCLACASCLAMAQGSHPDFIEIDAASNTGVDNIRQLIETAAYMPLGGNKKVFLIDEAHMLSKAAFNAFLKLLEEPPKSVLFILATTELHKIPQTVLSRCFQVLFSAIESSSLHTHLATLCKAENINIEPQALDIIIQESEGSARDAINLLEQVRFAHTNITVQDVLNSIGKLSNEALVAIVTAIIEKNAKALLQTLQSLNTELLNPESIWQSLIDICKALLWIKYDSQSIQNNLHNIEQQLTQLANHCSINRLHSMIKLLCSQEMQFLKTSRKYAFLEIVLIQLCTQTDTIETHNKEDKKNSNNNSSGPIQRPFNKTKEILEQPAPLQKTVDLQKSTPTIAQATEETKQTHSPLHTQWEQFKTSLAVSNNDPMVITILQQAHLVGIAENQATLVIRLNRNSKFLKDSVDSAKSLWLPILLQHFTEIKTVEFSENQEATAAPIARINPATNTASIQTKQEDQGRNTIPTATPNNNPEEWPIANTLKKYIPGKIKKSHLLN